MKKALICITALMLVFSLSSCFAINKKLRIIGDTDEIIVAFDSNMYNEFKGYVKVNKVIKDNELYLEFEVDGSKLTAIWQPGDNYGVWQQCGYEADDYSGYLLFPTYDKAEYFCLRYSC